MDFITIAGIVFIYFLIATVFAIWDGREPFGIFGYSGNRALFWPRTLALTFFSSVARWASGMWNGREVDFEKLGVPLADIRARFEAAAVPNPLPCGGTRKRHLYLGDPTCGRCGTPNPDWKGEAAVSEAADLTDFVVGTAATTDPMDDIRISMPIYSAGGERPSVPADQLVK